MPVEPQAITPKKKPKMYGKEFSVMRRFLKNANADDLRKWVDMVIDENEKETKKRVEQVRLEYLELLEEEKFKNNMLRNYIKMPWYIKIFKSRKTL